ncbi:MAG: Flap endonuclease 1 [Methanoregulaceae archaeon PtaB.Bin108]|jgi:flap endonuclease-1|nr:MAG: Flap endonuclease 1 [Methanoregulaceae archaeon PtaB.Bin108]OPY42020.1 MAG: Flap endonuclease 1 [Methanoregulaceae archaeon PtaU1.Bin222]
MGVAFRDILGDYKEPVSWESLAGTGALDAHNAIYQFLSIIRQPDGTPLMDQEGRVTSHLSGILFRSANFIEKGIRTVWVFDGSPPEIKKDTIQERRVIREHAGEKWQEALERGDTEAAYKHARSSSRIDEEVLRTSRELLDLLGLPCVQAPSEGEAQAAHMVKRGDCRYVVSQDYDTLLFGSPVLARNLTVSGKRKIRGRTISVTPERIMLPLVLKGLALTREDLVKVAILVGTDFNSGIRGVGAKTALRLVQSGEFEQTIQEKAPDTDWETIMDFFINPPVTDGYSLEWKIPNREGILRMLCDRYDFSPERIERALGGMDVKSGQKTLDSWF